MIGDGFGNVPDGVVDTRDVPVVDATPAEVEAMRSRGVAPARLSWQEIEIGPETGPVVPRGGWSVLGAAPRHSREADPVRGAWAAAGYWVVIAAVAGGVFYLLWIALWVVLELFVF